MDSAQRRRHTQVLYGNGKEPTLEIDEAEDGREVKKLKSTAARVPTKEPSVPKKRFPIKIRSEHPPTPAVVAVRKLTCRTGEPWAKAKKMFLQKGMTICNGSSYQQLHVAVQQRKIEPGNAHHLRHFSHNHIVNLLDACLVSEDLYLVYEYMDVSLRSIASLTKKMSYQDIATVCKSVSLHHKFEESSLTFEALYGVAVYSCPT